MNTPHVSTKNIQHITLPIYNLSCGGGGSLTIERVLAHTLGVEAVYVNPATEMAFITYNSEQSNPEQLTAIIERAGFSSKSLQSHSTEKR